MAPIRRISRKQFLGYLKKLEQGLPVPEPKLHQAALEFGLDFEELLHGTQRQHVIRDQVRYLDLDLDLDLAMLNQWKAAVSVQHATPRIDQAALGNSHNARVNGVMLTVRSRRQPHPQVVLIDAKGTIEAGTAGPPARPPSAQ